MHFINNLALSLLGSYINEQCAGSIVPIRGAIVKPVRNQVLNVKWDICVVLALRIFVHLRSRYMYTNKGLGSKEPRDIDLQSACRQLTSSHLYIEILIALRTRRHASRRRPVGARFRVHGSAAPSSACSRACRASPACADGWWMLQSIPLPLHNPLCPPHRARSCPLPSQRELRRHGFKLCPYPLFFSLPAMGAPSSVRAMLAASSCPSSNHSTWSSQSTLLLTRVPFSPS